MVMRGARGGGVAVSLSRQGLLGMPSVMSMYATKIGLLLAIHEGQVVR